MKKILFSPKGRAFFWSCPGFFKEKVSTPLEFFLSFCYFYILQLVVFADFEITILMNPPLIIYCSDKFF